MTEKKKEKSKYHSFQQFLGKAAGETITEKDIEKGLNSQDPNVVKMAKAAEKRVNKKKNISKEEYTELNGVRIQSARIGMEAFAGADIKHLLTDSFPILVSDVKGFFNKFSPNAPGAVLNINKNEFIKEITKHPYLDISPLAAFVPEGLDVTYLEYAKVLEEAALHASGVLNGVMSEYSTFLGQIISNADAKLSTISFNKEHENLEHNRYRLNEELGDCFKHGSTITEVNLGKVVKRNLEWEEVFKSTDLVIKLINSVDRSALNKKIAECVQYLDIILDKVKRNELDNLSPEGIKNLSVGAYNIASELEFFSACYYKVLAYCNCVERTALHFESIFKK